MELILGVIVVGVIAFCIFGGFVMLASMLGIPLERKKTVDKREAIAKQMWEDKLNAEAARNVALRAAEKRMGG